MISTLTALDAEWRTRADCRTHDDPDLWFPEDHKGPSLTITTEAKTICRTCPVRVDCLEDALTNEGGKKPASRYGIRGGLTPEQRFNEARRRQRRDARLAAWHATAQPKPAPKPTPTPRQPAQCGTRPGYRLHRKNGETACGPCRQANTDADNRLRRTGTTKVPA